MSNLVSSEGLGLDAVSEGELLTALKGGVPNEKIVFHGNNKSDKEIDFAIRNNIKIIVDNDYDLRRLEELSNSLNNDLESPNRNIMPITTSIEGDGKLSVGGCSIEGLVKKYGSPLYILDEISLRTSCRAYKKALEKYYPGESLPIYASKANSSIFMSNLVSSEGLGLDAVSEGELLTALKGGVPCLLYTSDAADE